MRLDAELLEPVVELANPFRRESRAQSEHGHGPYIDAAQVLFPGAAEKAEERMFGAAG